MKGPDGHGHPRVTPAPAPWFALEGGPRLPREGPAIARSPLATKAEVRHNISAPVESDDLGNSSPFAGERRPSLESVPWGGRGSDSRVPV